MTIEEKNVEIAKMLGWEIKLWEGVTQPYYRGKLWNKWSCGAAYKEQVEKSLSSHVQHFHSDANWQFEAIEFIENLDNGIYSTSITHDHCISNYGCDSVEIDFKNNSFYPDEYKNEPIVFVLTKGKKEAIFEALYQFSQYLKEKK